MITWKDISHILDDEIKRNTEARIASQDLDLSNISKSRSSDKTSKKRENLYEKK